MPHQATSTPTPTCQPWCVNHDPEGDICHAPNLVVDGSPGWTDPCDVGLSHSPEYGGPAINVGDRYAPPGEAARLVRAILAQLTLAGVAV